MAAAWVTMDEFRDYLTDDQVDHEPKLRAALDTAHVTVVDQCNRSFGQETSASARTFVACDARTVEINDAATISSVKVDTADNGTFDQTWTVTTDYIAAPAGNIGPAGQTGWAYSTIRSVGSYLFPTTGYRRRVEVTAVWGWPSVPAPIKQATLQLAHRLFELRDAGLGVAGLSVNEMGTVEVAVRSIPGWSMLLDPYRTYGARGILVG